LVGAVLVDAEEEVAGVVFKLGVGLSEALELEHVGVEAFGGFEVVEVDGYAVVELEHCGTLLVRLSLV
jgi:hypothetical protein